MTTELTVQPAHGRFEHEIQPSHRNAAPVRRLFRYLPHHPHPPAAVGLKKLLDDAEYLIDYAAESGIKLDDNDADKDMVRTVISARSQEKAGEKLSDDDTVKAIAAVTSLSAKLKPVSAKTLRACKDEATRTVRTYRRIATYRADSQKTVQLSIMSEGGSGTPVPDLSIEVDDIDEALRRVKHAGFPVEYGPVDEPWGVRRFFTRDPFGRLVNVLVHAD